MRLQQPAVALAAQEFGIKVMQPVKMRDEAMHQSLRDLNADIGVVVAYGRILPPQMLAIPPRGMINVHASLLPKYRGAAPIQRAIEAGDTTTGVTIMRIDEQLDHGPMLSVAELSIGEQETTPQLAARLAELGGRLLIEALDALEENRAVETEQDHALATHAAKLTRDEGRINWSHTARQIQNRSRAFTPWPGLFIERKGEGIRVLGVTAVSEMTTEKEGRILAVTDGSIDVAAADGRIRIQQLQRPGKKPSSASEFVRAAGIGVGDLLS